MGDIEGKLTQIEFSRTIVKKYIPNCPVYAQPLTHLSLLNHMSG
jgi:hypothetical protein